MKYGILEKNNQIYCANCKKIVGKDGKLKSNFCDVCGNPLNEIGFTIRSSEYSEQRGELVTEIAIDLKKGKTIDEIMKQYFDSMK